MLRLLVTSFVALFLLSNGAIAQSCSGFPWTNLTNGYPADASQVMNNFKCVLSSPYFSGNVGIGTTSPSSALHLVGSSGAIERIYSTDNTAYSTSDYAGIATMFLLNQSTTAGTGSGIAFGVTGAGPGAVASIAGISTASDYSTALVFQTRSSSGADGERMRITSTGNVGIGTTSATNLLQVGSSSTRGTVNIVGTAFASPATLTFSDTANIAHSYSIYQGNIYGIGLFDQNTSQWRMVWADNGNVGIGTYAPAQALEVSGKIQVDALASATSTNLCVTSTSNGVIATCSSSIRYKEDVHDATFGLRQILAMRPVTFKWKGRNENDFGLIAEEMAKINPQFVTYKDGKIEGVKYPQLTAVLVNAIKELELKNEKQAGEISSQEKEISVLRAQQDAQAGYFNAQLAAMQRRMRFNTAQN